MTCTNVGFAIICTSPFGRLHVGNRYIYVDYHPYCRPAFYTDRNMDKEYFTTGADDPVWDALDVWLKKRKIGGAA